MQHHHKTASENRPYLGRFAPSPTGDLHFGSLVAAVASYLEARRHGGEWLVRIEDIDPPRQVEGSAERILRDLNRLGMTPDGEILFQSDRSAAFEEAVERLIAQGDAYWCGCSRADLPPSGIYPGTCRAGLARGRRRRSVRLRTKRAEVSIVDSIQGDLHENLDIAVGDFVIRRADGLPAYQLAVVVDDAFQRITHVVRGADLLESTPRQVYLQHQLGLPTPRYAHVPVVLGPNGSKLGKRMKSDPVGGQDPASALAAALSFLGQDPPAETSLDALWGWALEHWDLGRVSRARQIPSPP